MRTRKISIAGLMALVLFTGVGIAAMSRPSALWAAVMFSGATLFLTSALIAAVCVRKERRAFWIGATIGGWAYLFLHYGPFCETQIGRHTVTTAALDLLYPLTLHEPHESTTFQNPVMFTGAFTPGSPTPVTPPGAAPLALTFGFPTPPARTPWTAWTAIDQNGAWLGTQTPHAFYRAGHSLLSVLVALIAGVFAARVSRSEHPPVAAVA
jgi:hypothetical protein